MDTVIIVEIKVRNRTDYPVTKKMPKGTIIEVDDPNAIDQHGMVVRDYYITIPPKQIVTIYVEAMCFIRRRQWPQATRANLTPYNFAGLIINQDDLWKQLGY